MNLGRRRRRICVVLITVLLWVLADCNSPPAQQRPAAPPKSPWTGLLAQVRAVWSAEPGIDLLTGPAVVVRAYNESFTLARLMGDIDYVYPGFPHAVAPYAPNSPESARSRWPDTDHRARYPTVGTFSFHILRIDTAGKRATAIVCDWAYKATHDLGNGKYGSGLDYPYGLGDGIAVYWISMTAPSNGGHGPPLPPQKGPAPAPADDVFDGWRIDGHFVDFVDDPVLRHPDEWPSQQADAQQCQTKAPDPKERRIFLSEGVHPRSDYPTLPPFPGWPPASAQ